MSHSDLKTLQKVVDEILANAKSNRREISGAINWTDLSCVDVEEILNLSGEHFFKIYIEEAQPNAVRLVEFIENELRKRGFHSVVVETEW